VSTLTPRARPYATSPPGLVMRRFLQWWVGELAGLLPEAVRRRAHQRHRRLVLELRADHLLVERQTGDVREPAGRVPYTGPADPTPAPLLAARGGGTPVTLRLPAGAALRKVLWLPAVAAENLRDVLGFEMDRQTPFRAEQVYYDCRIVRRAPAEGRIEVELVLVPRPVLDRLLETLRAWGVRPQEVEVAGAGPGIDLLPAERGARAAGWRSRIDLALTLLAVGLLVAALALPVWRTERALEGLRTAVAQAQYEAQSVTALREELEARAREARFLAEQKRAQAVVIDVLNELTRVLPDGTWITQFDLRGTSVQVQGESTASAALIGRMETSPMFRSVAFRSPVTQNPASGRERFQIAAELNAGAGP
jgi:general secretion pathway protein L